MDNEAIVQLLAAMAETCAPELDGGNFRDCIITQVQGQRVLECAPTVYLIRAPGCPGCEEAEREMTPMIEQGKVTVIDSDNPIAYNLLEQIAQQDGAIGVPNLVIADCEGNLISELEIVAQEQDNV